MFIPFQEAFLAFLQGLVENCFIASRSGHLNLSQVLSRLKFVLRLRKFFLGRLYRGPLLQFSLKELQRFFTLVCFKEPFGHCGVFGEVERLEVLNAAMAGWLSPIHDPFPLSSWTFLWLPRWTSVVGQEGLCGSRSGRHIFFMRTTKEKAVALHGKRQKLNHVLSGKADTLECISCPGSVQLGNFISCLFCKSAGKKSRYFFKCNGTLLYGHSLNMNTRV